MRRIAISAYSGRPPIGLEDEARRLIGLLKERCGDTVIYVGGYRGLMRTVVEEALHRDMPAIAVIPVEYEEDVFPPGLLLVSTGMSFKGRNVVLVRSGEVLAALGGGAGSLMEIFAAYGMARKTHLLIGWGLPTDKLAEAYPEGRIGEGPRLISYHTNVASMADALCGQRS
jgi:uncharacterized protein (TIGR00725 family)